MGDGRMRHEEEKEVESLKNKIEDAVKDYAKSVISNNVNVVSIENFLLESEFSICSMNNPDLAISFDVYFGENYKAVEVRKVWKEISINKKEKTLTLMLNNCKYLTVPLAEDKKQNVKIGLLEAIRLLEKTTNG